LSRALAKIPNDRYPTCGQFITALDHAQHLDRRRRRLFSVAKMLGLFFSLLLTILLVWFLVMRIFSLAFEDNSSSTFHGVYRQGYCVCRENSTGNDQSLKMQ
ncbi:MAG: hypothetical protein Q4G59_01335, partial [Planctomycetia bacterium]|nr:hypothetical protein [Planctomycetia bacterium]